ncbi:MAG: hypothetical protein IMZ55_03940 [Acidobacteria bacterium]|nr:hypothetical protein [Acidobacteriota bacterium]
MATRHLSEDELVLYHYREAGDAEAVASHLESCDACRAVYRALQQTLSAVGTLAIPEPDETFESRMWRRVEFGLTARRRHVWLELFRQSRLALAGAMAMLLVAAFVAGRYWPRAVPAAVAPSAQASDARVRDRILLVAVGDHLERSRMALLELVNTEGAERVDISTEQAWVRDLVPENRLYRQTASQAGEAGMASLLDDLERVLLEIANSPSTLSSDEFDGIRQRIEAQGIIFKVRVLGSEVRERQQEAARALPRTRS